MSPNVRDKFSRGINPFDFKGKNSFIRPLDRGISKLNDKGPCVVMASPGFLTNGVSRELLEKWAPDPRNGLIITGYSVEGVMARVSWLFGARAIFCFLGGGGRTELTCFGFRRRS
jgi:cleavage and polyadenylation specificity factor subunit 3